MIKVIILIVSACLFPTEAIYLKSNKTERIIGGNVAFAGEYPFMAAIQKRTDTGTYFCAGTLLNSPWILTAGQCVIDGILFTIRLGSNSLNQNDPNAIRVATEHYFVHPDFNANTLQNDIGLIRLRQPVEFTDYIKPIGGISRIEIVPDTTVLIAGWGHTNDEEADLVDTLNRVSLVTLSNEECKVIYGSQITENMVCAAGNYNEGLCQGDIGGPLIQQGYSLKYHVGIASFLSSRGCENTDPSGFTRTAPYVDWIQEVIINN